MLKANQDFSLSTTIMRGERKVVFVKEKGEDRLSFHYLGTGELATK